jgi:hypothetical protein
VTRRLLLAAVGLSMAGILAAQLVPLSRCQAALPCSIPFGLRPADTVAFSPYARTGSGNTAISVSAGVEEGLKPRIDAPPLSDDQAARAARLFLKRNPPPRPTATPHPPK